MGWTGHRHLPAVCRCPHTQHLAFLVLLSTLGLDRANRAPRAVGHGQNQGYANTRSLQPSQLCTKELLLQNQPSIHLLIDISAVTFIY